MRLLSIEIQRFASLFPRVQLHDQINSRPKMAIDQLPVCAVNSKMLCHVSCNCPLPYILPNQRSIIEKDTELPLQEVQAYPKGHNDRS